MFKLKYLRVEFDAKLRQHEVPAFRGAIAGKVGPGEVLFHHHATDGLRYSYPLIQYKLVQQRPAILCLGAGVDEIHKYFQTSDWTIHIGEKEVPMKIWKLDMQQFTMQVWDKPFYYSLNRWIALDQASWKDFQQTTSMAERIRLLETKMVGNILSLAKGIGWTVDREIKCEITDLKNSGIVKVKGVNLNAFDLDFRSNVFLPGHIGLGGKVSIGFGVVSGHRTRQA